MDKLFEPENDNYMWVVYIAVIFSIVLNNC